MTQTEADREREIAKPREIKVKNGIWHTSEADNFAEENKMKNFIFSDHFHQIIYIIPALSTTAPRPLYPRFPPPLPLVPSPSIPAHRPLYPRTPPPPSTRPIIWEATWCSDFSILYVIKALKNAEAKAQHKLHAQWSANVLDGLI